jgi:hypothetical protein
MNDDERRIWYFEREDVHIKKRKLVASEVSLSSSPCYPPPKRQIGGTCYYYAVIGLFIVSSIAQKTIFGIIDCLKESIPKPKSAVIDDDTPPNILALIVIDHVYQYITCRTHGQTLPTSPIRRCDSSDAKGYGPDGYIHAMNMRGPCRMKRGGHFDDIVDRFVRGIPYITGRPPDRMFVRIAVDDDYTDHIMQSKKHMDWVKFMEHCMVGLLVAYRGNTAGHSVAFWFDPESKRFYKYDSRNGAKFQDFDTSLEPWIVLDRNKIHIEQFLQSRCPSIKGTGFMLSYVLSIPNPATPPQEILDIPSKFEYLTASYVSSSLRIALVATNAVYVCEFDDNDNFWSYNKDMWLKMEIDHPHVPPMDMFAPEYFDKIWDRAAHAAMNADTTMVRILRWGEEDTYVRFEEVMDELDMINSTIPNIFRHPMSSV